MGSFGGETRTGYERRSNVEHDHDESKDQRQTQHHAHEHTPEGRRAASLKPAAPGIFIKSPTNWGLLATFFWSALAALWRPSGYGFVTKGEESRRSPARGPHEASQE